LACSRATQQRVDQADRATGTSPDIVSANPSATVVAIADTPFATMPDTPDCAPLKRAERVNVVFVVVFVLAASQFAQILVVAVVTATINLILGLIVLSPELLNEWTHTYKSTGINASGAGFADPYDSFPGRVDVHVHQRPRGRRRRVSLDIPRPADR
jgi:hypothetical protein